MLLLKKIEKLPALKGGQIEGSWCPDMSYTKVHCRKCILGPPTKVNEQHPATSKLTITFKSKLTIILRLETLRNTSHITFSYKPKVMVNIDVSSVTKHL